MARTRVPSWMTMDPSELGKAGAQSLHITCQECLIPHLNYRISTCPSCSLPYCTDHLFRDYHHCDQRQKQRNTTSGNSTATTNTASSLPSKPTVFTHETQCSHLTCKKMIDPSRGQGGTCDQCHKLFCWSHQKEFAHECIKPATTAGTAATARAKGLAAFNLFKAKNASRKAASTSNAKESPASSNAVAEKKTITRFVPNALLRTTSNNSTGSTAAAMQTLRATAKGTASIPEPKRVFVYVTAQSPPSSTTDPSSTASAKAIELNACFNADWKVGRALDKALDYCSLENRNNRTSEYEEKWDMLLLGAEKSKVLEANERFGDVVKTGDRIVLMKGIGPVQ